MHRPVRQNIKGLPQWAWWIAGAPAGGSGLMLLEQAPMINKPIRLIKAILARLIVLF